MRANLLADPGPHDHFVQLYDEPLTLARALADYVGTGLARGEAAMVIATPAHRSEFLRRIEGAQRAIEEGRLNVLDVEQTLGRFMANGMPQWTPFHEVVGGLIAELRLRYPAVRAYGEMVDVLWQRGERDAALRLEQYWTELAQLQTFSLFCAYKMDPLDKAAYGGPLESVCNAYTHMRPTADAAALDCAVESATRKVLDEPLADILLSLAGRHRPGTQMPAGQATLFWLHHNMPRTAEKVLSEMRVEKQRAAASQAT